MALSPRLSQQPDSSGFNVIDGAGQFHASFMLPFADLGRFQDLAHAPSHIGLDRLGEKLDRGELRIEMIERRNDAIDQQLDSGMMP